MIKVEGLVGCLPCKLLHNRLMKEGIMHAYVIVDGEDGIYYPRVIVDGVALPPMSVDEYVRELKGE